MPTSGGRGRPSRWGHLLSRDGRRLRFVLRFLGFGQRAFAQAQPRRCAAGANRARRVGCRDVHRSGRQEPRRGPHGQCEKPRDGSLQQAIRLPLQARSRSIGRLHRRPRAIQRHRPRIATPAAPRRNRQRKRAGPRPRAVRLQGSRRSRSTESAAASSTAAAISCIAEAPRAAEEIVRAPGGSDQDGYLPPQAGPSANLRQCSPRLAVRQARHICGGQLGQSPRGPAPLDEIELKQSPQVGWLKLIVTAEPDLA